jgi:hypothetical protein
MRPAEHGVKVQETWTLFLAFLINICDRQDKMKDVNVLSKVKQSTIVYSPQATSPKVYLRMPMTIRNLFSHPAAWHWVHSAHGTL